MTQQVYLLGIDIGTTTSKGVLVTLDGQIVAQVAFTHDISRPFPRWAEHDAQEDWWGGFVRVCSALLEKTEVDPHDIAAVSCSTLYPALVPVDREGTPLRKGILYGIDARALAEIEMIRNTLGEEYCRNVSGNGLTTHSIAPKILWIKDKEPEVFARTYKFLNASSYITFRLTDEFCIDHGSASLGGVPYRVDGRGWDEETLKICGIRESQMPELVWGDEYIGHLSKKAAAETGLAEGTVVAAGTGDHVAESLSFGFVRGGNSSISYGTTFGLDVCIEKPVIYPGLQLSASCFKNIYMVGGGMFNGCSLTRWYKETFAHFDEEIKNRDGFDEYLYLNKEASTVAPGCDGLISLPYFSGEKVPFFDADARGVLFGLRLHHSGKYVYRSLLEGIAFGIRHTIEVIQQSGLSINRVISVGGGTGGGVWPQIISDVTGFRQEVLKPSSGSAMGAAFLGGLIAGVVTDKDEIQKWNTLEMVAEPNPENKAVYDRYYRIYRELYQKTKDLTRLL